MNVLVIPEDATNDQFVLKPIVTKLLELAGIKTVNLRVCQEPRLRGVYDALKSDRIAQVIRRHRYQVDLFLLIVDRDGKPGRRLRLDEIEQEAKKLLASNDQWFLAENAWQEVEVWALAGVDKSQWLKGWDWKAIREEVNPKEVYFEPLAAARGLANEPGQGRVTLGREAAQNYPRIRSLCREDVAELETRVRALKQT